MKKKNVAFQTKISPAVVLCGAPCWWGGSRKSAATGAVHTPQARMSPAAGQPLAPSGHTEPAGTRPRTVFGTPYRTGGQATLNNKVEGLPFLFTFYILVPCHYKAVP